MEKSPSNTELLIARAEIFTFAGTADAADVVASLVPRAADALFHTSWYPVKLAHAYHLQQSGARAEAAKTLDQILEANRQSIVGGADWPIVFAQNAAARALRGETAAALGELDRAYAAGWREQRMLAIDPLLASLRAEPRFTQLLARIEADVAGMRARANYSGLPD